MLIILLPLLFSCTVDIFPLCYRILYRVDCVKIKDTATISIPVWLKLQQVVWLYCLIN